MQVGIRAARWTASSWRRLALLAAAALLAPALAVHAAGPARPAPSEQSRLAAPRTDAPVQPDSLFAPVVAARPVSGVIAHDGARAPRGASEHRELSLDGTWRFALEGSDCDADETRCEGITGGWFTTGFDDSSWRTLAVPGHFARQIPLEELGGRGSTLPFHFAWYRRRFTLPGGEGGIDPARQRLRLELGAVDYRADVWLDGALLTTQGSHLGTFNPFAFDLPPLDAGVEHVLVVRVQKPLDPGILSCGAGIGGFLDRKIKIDGTKGYHDSRPGGNDDMFDPVEKQALHSGGIVAPVRLVATGDLRLDWVFVTALPSPRGGADVLLSYTVTNLAAVPLRATVATRLVGSGTAADAGVTVQAEVEPGSSRIEARTHLARAALWFPALHPELGEPALYRAESALLVGTTRDGDGTISDQRTDRFGIRSLGLASDRCEDRFAGVPPDPACADDFRYTASPPRPGETPDRPLYQRFVNGKRIFAAGASGIPSPWVAEVDQPAAERFVGLLRAVNANHLNLHGHVSSPALYDVADESGVTIVQDFELQWGYDEAGTTFACGDNGYPTPAGDDPARGARVVATAAALAADMTYLLYNHPSIVQWVAHNEPPWELAEEVGTVGQVDRTLDRRVADVITGIDATRPVKGGSGVGDSHDYRGFFSCSFHDVLGVDPSRQACFDSYQQPTTYPTEFGSMAVPFSARRWMPPELLFPSDPALRRQTWTDANARNANELVPWLREWVWHASRLDVLATYVGSPADYDRFEDFALATQLYQSALLKFYIEHYRKDRFRPTAGLRFFWLRDYWDSAFLGVFDELDLPSAAAPAVRDALAPLLVTSELTQAVYRPGETIRLPVWIVNDLHRALPAATLLWRIVEVDDRYVLRGVVDATTPPFQDVRRGAGDPALLPPQPVLTFAPRPAAVAQLPALVAGSRAVSVPGDSVSPPEGEVVLEFVPPPSPERLRTYLLELSLESDGQPVAHNEHLIAVADPAFAPPPGLSDGVRRYGTGDGDRRFSLTLELHGLPPGGEVALDTPGFAGATARSIAGRADADGRSTFAGLVPGEYVVRSAGTEVADLALTESRVVELVAAGSSTARRER